MGQIPHIARNEVVHGKSTAFAPIVGEQYDADVLDRDNQGERPYNE